MSLRFIHTGDIHIGAKFVNLGKKGSSQRDQIRRTFEKIVDLAIGRKVNAFLIAGDLFDTMCPSEYSISFVKRQIEKLSTNNIWTIIVPGTHDRLESGSVFSATDFGSSESKVHVFNNPFEQYFEVPELDAVFYAKPNLTSKSSESPIAGFEKRDGSANHILLAHGSYQIEGKSSLDDYPFTDEEIQNSGMDYIAFAHWHNVLEMSKGKTKAYYSGSPELVALDQKGSGNVLLVEIDNDSVKVETIKTGIRYVKELVLDVGEFENLYDLISRIHKESDANCILNLVLTGFWKTNVSFDKEKFLDELENSFFAIVFSDKSNLSSNNFDSNLYPSDYLIGKFIRIVGESDLSEKEKSEVLRYGISLLEGKDVL